MDRTILHCDCNGFYASVECTLNPQLWEKPMAVCGNAQNRHGIILAKNELAKKFNILTGETIWMAQRKCPDLRLVEPNHEEYIKYSKAVNKIYESYTDMVEPFGIDESWLDVTGSYNLFGDGKTIADSLRKRVREELGITISVGVSFNKVFSKLGSDYKKPNATTVIDRQNYRDVVFPLPVSALLYAGKSACLELKRLGIHSVGDLAMTNMEIISMKLGKHGETIWNYANGNDDSPIAYSDEKRMIKSVGNGMTFKRDLIGIDDIKLGVITLADSVATRMRALHMKCQTVKVCIKDTTLKVISRQKKLDAPTNLSKEIYDISLEIIGFSWDIAVPIRMISVTGTNLVLDTDGGGQLTFFHEEINKSYEKREKLENAIDGIRSKFGKNSIYSAGILGNDLGIDKSHTGDWSNEEER